MQTSYGFSGLLCFSKTNTNSHSHSAPALYLRVTAAGKASEQHALLHGCSQASSSASKLILCQRKLPKHAKHAKTCHRNVHACQCTKLSRFVKKLSKSFLKEVRNSTVARESLRANKRSPTFHKGGLAQLPASQAGPGGGRRCRRGGGLKKVLKVQTLKPKPFNFF